MSEAERIAHGTRVWRVAAPAVAALLPLAVWPGINAPFSTPKRWLLAAAVAVLLPVAVWQAAQLRGHARRRLDDAAPAVPAGLQAILVAWLASFAWSALAAPTVSPDALLLGIAGPLWCLLIALTSVAFTRHAAAHVAGTTVVACIALAQAAGLDPFVWWGWVPGIVGASVRMRVYGTLGNPNFVAALMAMTFPLACGLAVTASLSRRMRAMAAVATVLLGAALAATGSRAGAIGLVCGIGVFAVLLRHRSTRWVVAGAVLAATVTVLASGARGPVETLRGRVYVWQTAWAHVWDAPVSGIGPGAFELHYADWDREARASGSAKQRDTRFSGPQQFAHNDDQQNLIERGVGGLVATVLLFATPIFVWRRSRVSMPGPRAALAGAAGAVAACAAVACFDFPLQRPAETAALWMAAALAWQASRSLTSTSSHTGEMTE